MPVGSSGVAGGRPGSKPNPGTDAALNLLTVVSDPNLYKQRIAELDAKEAKVKADLATLAERHKEQSAKSRDLEAREKAVETRESVATEREAQADDRETKLEAREQTVKDRRAECRKTEADIKRRTDKLIALQKGAHDAADLLRQHDAMQGIGMAKIRADGEKPGPGHFRVSK